MTPRDNLCVALDGKRPAWIPYTVNQEFVSDDPTWNDLVAAGLCPIPYVGTVREKTVDVERTVAPVTWQGHHGQRVTLRTSVGEISQIEVNGWVQEYFLKTPADYRVMEYIVRHTHLALAPAGFEASETRVGDRVLTYGAKIRLILIGRRI